MSTTTRRARLIRNSLIGSALLLAAAPVLIAAPGDDNALGRKTYQDNCASCHGDTFSGAFGPPLSGPDFVSKWDAQSPQAFAEHVRTMPPVAPNSLSPETYAAVIELIRSTNGLPKDTGSADVPGTLQGASAPDKYNVTVVAPDLGDKAFKANAERLRSLATKLPPVTDAMLHSPDAGNWLSWRRTQDSYGFSPLDQINKDNAGQLTLAWALPLGPGSDAIAPLAYDGVMFINSSGTVRALDAQTGDEIWKFDRPATTTRVPLTQPRGIALYGGAVYAPTIDNHVIALDMHSGKMLWDQPIAGPEGRLETTAAPLAVRGKIIQGMAGCQGDTCVGGCYSVALDAATGKEAWRFHTIARPGEPGGDSWNGAPLEQRFGGSVWTAPSYDADLNLLYFGTAQTYNISPLTRTGGPTKPGSKDALYTNSTLAIDPDTGKLAWSFQHFPGDIWDLDWSFEQTLVPLNGKKAVVTIGKLGIVEAVDAKTGRYLWSKDLGLQNLVTKIDPKTGRKSYDPALIPEKGVLKQLCPSALGVRNWLATALDPTTGQLFVPMVESCMQIGLRDTGNSGSGELLLKTVGLPGNDGQFGRIAAFDLNSHTVTWQNRRRAAQASAALATAGGIMFEGSLDRWFRAVDSATGKTLWQARLDDSPHSFPISFAADGTQYVAVVTGGGTPHDSVYRGFTPEFQTPVRQRTLWVFKLAGK